MKINWGGKPKPEPKEVINDEVLGTVKVFNDGLVFDNSFFPDYEGLEFKYVTDKNEQIPVKITKTEGFDVDYDEFGANKEEYLTHIRRIHSFEKLIMDEVLSQLEDEIPSELSFESEEFRNSLVSITITVGVDLKDVLELPDEADVSSYTTVLSEHGAWNLAVWYSVDLANGTIECVDSDAGHE